VSPPQSQRAPHGPVGWLNSLFWIDSKGWGNPETARSVTPMPKQAPAGLCCECVLAPGFIDRCGRATRFGRLVKTAAAIRGEGPYRRRPNVRGQTRHGYTGTDGHRFTMCELFDRTSAISPEGRRTRHRSDPGRAPRDHPACHSALAACRFSDASTWMDTPRMPAPPFAPLPMAGPAQAEQNRPRQEPKRLAGAVCDIPDSRMGPL